ncbi:hypothetical protein Slin15195_G038790 [Septoria linicola]|uniref:Uncharacterized protein n=1 Tax=Septoria linicola TaxID=215465 RepID=A0A9Q9AQ76_9PEZI|nr:hypothetical protein Slin15195_G038790 [Septoria linicola]
MTAKPEQKAKKQPRELRHGHDLVENKDIWIIDKFERFLTTQEACIVTWKPVWITAKEREDLAQYVDEDLEGGWKDRPNDIERKHYVRFQMSSEPVTWIKQSAESNIKGLKEYLDSLTAQMEMSLSSSGRSPPVFDEDVKS